MVSTGVFSTGDLKILSSAKQNENLHRRPSSMTSANPAENGVDTFWESAPYKCERRTEIMHLQFTRFECFVVGFFFFLFSRRCGGRRRIKIQSHSAVIVHEYLRVPDPQQ